MEILNTLLLEVAVVEVYTGLNMAHYALIDENGIVTNVIVAQDEDDLNGLPEEFSSWEDYIGEQYGVTCKRTSYNTINNIHLEEGIPFRANYAQIGGRYDEINDVFIPLQPFASWTLNTTNWFWEAPLEKPAGRYYWDEELYQTDNTKGWVE